MAIDYRYTTGEAAALAGYPTETLRTLLKTGAIDEMLPDRQYGGKHTMFTRGEVALLRLVREVSKLLPVASAVRVAVHCQPGVMQYLFDEKPRFRYLSVAIFEDSEPSSSLFSASCLSVDSVMNHKWNDQPAWDFKTGLHALKITVQKPYMGIVIDLSTISLPTIERPEAV